MNRARRLIQHGLPFSRTGIGRGISALVLFLFYIHFGVVHLVSEVHFVPAGAFNHSIEAHPNEHSHERGESSHHHSPDHDPHSALEHAMDFYAKNHADPLSLQTPVCLGETLAPQVFLPHFNVNRPEPGLPPVFVRVHPASPRAPPRV